jgi:FtsK/SpoIIIE family
MLNAMTTVGASVTPHSQTVSEQDRRIAQFIAVRTWQLLTNSNVLREEGDGPALYVWPRADRVVLILDALRVRNADAITNNRFRHHLSSLLQSRRVVITNTRGFFVQVAYWPEPARPLVTRDLDLSQQPTSLSVPIGVTARGDLWLSLADLDAVLIGGSRRMGKTNLLHGWIMALWQGQETQLLLFDGKGGVEFERYRGAARVRVITGDLEPELGSMSADMFQRLDLLKAAHAKDLAEYNRGRQAGERLERIVLVVDELAYALRERGVEDLLVDLAARGGAVGIHPVLATQRPSADVVTSQLKANLVTRIALPVPARADSMVILGRPGADRLAKEPGRLLLTWKARLIEAQAFRVRESANAIKSDERLEVGQLPERERRLAQAALARDGWFKIRELKDATGESKEELLALAHKWELRGWLTAVQRNERGHNLGRRITPKLQELLAESGEPGNVANQAEWGESGQN